MQGPDSAGLSVQADTPDAADLRKTLLWVCLLVGFAALGIAVLDLLLAAPERSEALIAGTLAAVAWACWLALRTRRLSPEPVAALVILGVLATATLSVVTYGSVRTAVNFLFVGAVVGAGIFLGRRALVLAVLATVALLGLLNWIEARAGPGRCPRRPPHPRTGS